MSGRHKRKGGPPFVQVHHWIMGTAAWRDLDPVARALYFELKLFYNGTNNGTIGLSVRQAGEVLGMSSATASRAFQRLIDHGFIVATTKGIPGTGSGYHHATEWLLTEAYDDRNGRSARKDFTAWRPENSLTVANNETRVSPMQRGGSEIPQDNPSRFTDATSKPVSEESTLHQRNTLTSSHRHTRRMAAAGGDQ